MKQFFTLILLTSVFLNGYGQKSKIKILLLGSDHLSQVYQKDYPKTDVLTPLNQNELKSFTALIEKFAPDMIGIEDTRDNQPETDSLYHLYTENKLKLDTLEYGRSERYQIAFRLGKSAGLDEITCVNYKGGTSQSILDNGDNIGIYKKEGMEMRELVIKKYDALKNGDLSIKQYLIFLNQPEAYKKIYHLRYITPAKVRNGTFKNPDKMVDNDFIDNEYIGAELISVFKNRDYKIYSNIVTSQMRKNAKRVLIVIGVGHIQSLKTIFSGDSDYEIVDANEYLKI